MQRRVRLTVVVVGVLALTAVAVASIEWGTASPARVWHRRGLEHGAIVVSERPGGQPLGGEWLAYRSCSEGGVDTLICGDLAAEPSWLDQTLQRLGVRRDPFADRTYSLTSITSDRDGATWRMFTRSPRFTGEGFTDDERKLVGRWRHVFGDRTIDLELRDDRTGRGSDGSCWEWLSAADGLELREKRVEELTTGTCDVWHCHGFVLGPDHTTYCDPDDRASSGTRLDVPAAPR